MLFSGASSAPRPDLAVFMMSLMVLPARYVFLYRSLYNTCCGKESRRLRFHYRDKTPHHINKGARTSSGIRPGRGAATRDGIILASGVRVHVNQRPDIRYGNHCA